MSALERVLDPDAGDRPAVLEILAEDPLGPAPRGSDDDERIPERQRVALFEFSRFEDVARRDRVHRPTAVPPDESARLRTGDDVAELAGEVHIQLLEHLGAQLSLSGSPQVGQDRSGDRRLLGFALVVGVEDDIRVDERPHRSYRSSRAGYGPPPRSYPRSSSASASPMTRS